MKNKPLVSVVIPTLPKRKKLLERAIRSVEKQTYKNIEIVVVAEGSSATEARNIGIDRANGKFIAFLDDDDEWMPEKTEKQIQVMNKHPECPLVICYSHDMRFNQDRINKPPEIIAHKMIIKSFNLSSTSSYLVRKTFLNILLVEKEYFDTNMRSAQEYDLAIRLSMHYDIRCVPEVLMIQHPTKGQISEDWNRKIDGIKAIAKKYRHEYSFMDKIKTFGVVNLFRIAKIPGVGNKIYKIIIPIKRRYEK